MNAAIRATVRIALYNGLKVSGIRRGYQGLIEADIDNMELADVGDIINRGRDQTADGQVGGIHD